MCECSGSEIKNLKAALAAEERVSDAYRTAYNRTLDLRGELRIDLDNAKAEHVRKLERELTACAGERDLAREMLRDMEGKYAVLLDGYTKKCNDFELGEAE